MATKEIAQWKLFAVRPKLEVHTHTYISGRRANGGCYIGDKWIGSTFSHSHEGGSVPHQHEATGPASYTIDKDEWFKATGLRGGGRKVFTVEPTGEQLPIKELEDWQKSFEIIVCDNPEGFDEKKFTGGAHYAAERMVQQFGMKVSSIQNRRTKKT